MKVTDLTVTMINWRSAGWSTGSNNFGGNRLLGVVTVSTDEGIEGHSFLGSSRQGADAFVGPLMEFVKPMLVGSNPLDIGDTWTKLKGGAPNIPFRDLVIQTRENDLVGATFGRSFYILDDYSALRGLDDAALEGDEALLFPVKDPWMYVPKRPLVW